MERPRVFRFLRIAVTALSLTACVLLIALWVRSYWWLDGIAGSRPRYMVASMQGTLYVDAHFGIERNAYYANSNLMRKRLGISSYSTKAFAPTWNGSGVKIPFWLLVVPTGALAAAPWIWRKWGFSLRTLLIATTLVAVGLVAIVLLN